MGNNSNYFYCFSILHYLLNPDNLLQLIGGILGTINSSYNIIMNFAEAFDWFEYIEDGC